MVPRSVLMRRRQQNREAQAFRQATQTAQRYRQQGISAARQSAIRSLNNLANKNNARNLARQLGPSGIKRLKVAALLTLLTAGGYAMLAVRAMRSNANKQNLVRLVQAHLL